MFRSKAVQVRTITDVFGNEDTLLGKEAESFVQSGEGSRNGDAAAQQADGDIEIAQSPCPA
jgi:hypothetical protein